MTFTDHFVSSRLADLELETAVVAPPSIRLESAVAAMREAGTSCVVASDGGPVAGIFTSRDVLLSVVDRPERWDRPLSEVMTVHPHLIGADESPLAALQVMNEYRLRHLPVVSEDGEVTGVLTQAGLLRLAAALLGAAGTAPAGVEQDLLFVDFRGVALAKPVCGSMRMALGDAVHQMRVRGIGSLMLVDGRGSLVGVLTDNDLAAKVACRVEDLEAVRAADYMTREPVTLSPRDPIAAGVHAMAENGFSHVPLVGATRRPVGMISFRDVAEYLEAILEAAG